ncbi:MAG: acyloxyacyl hydrolase [Flavobacteriales bacterium]|nr:acyloxyacyl hydrolase [Flavobacteriales bacterium]
MRSLFVALATVLPYLLHGANGPWTLGARLHYGSLWPHSRSSWILVQGHAVGAEVFAERRLLGDREWQRDYRGPSVGFGFLYADKGAPELIGASYRLVPYLFLPIVEGRNSCFGTRLGWGVGYISQAFDRRENTKQIAIGSRVNTAIQVMLEYRLRIDRTTLHTGLSLDHWSNGAVALPNLGLNLVTANVGVSYALGAVTPYVHVPDTARMKRPLREQNIVIAGSVCEVARPESGTHSVFSLIGNVQWRVTRKSSFGCGFDVFNKGTLGTLYPELLEKPRTAYTQVAVHGGYALGFGRGELLFQMGAYAYSPKPETSIVFHRFGMRYRIGKHLLAHVSLKSHYATADHWEFGIGYRWN